MFHPSARFRIEITLSLLAKMAALAAIGGLLFAPEDRPPVDAAAQAFHLMGEGR